MAFRTFRYCLKFTAMTLTIYYHITPYSTPFTSVLVHRASISPQVQENRCLLDLGQTEEAQRASLAATVRCIRGQSKSSLPLPLQSHPKSFAWD